MITKLTGNLLRLADDHAVISVDPFEYQVLIPEFTRRHLQLDVGNRVSLHTLHYLEGNAAQGGRLTPRLVGFVSEIEREFFELFCSVDGVGVKKALRAMVRPVHDVAKAIEQQDVKSMSTLPGIGPASAERIIAKLRRKMPKFALLVPRTDDEESAIEHSIVDDVYQVLITLGHTETEARDLMEKPLQSGKAFADVDSLLQEIYQQAQR